MLSLRAMRYFVAVAELGGVSAAAARANVSQPSVSEAIGQLESDLGVQLFVRRRGHGLALTAAGDRFLAQARNLITHAADVEKFAREMGSAASGEVRIGCFVTLAPFVLPGLLSRLAGAFPQIRPEPEEDNQEELLARLRAGRLDLAVTYGYSLTDEFDAETLTELPPRMIVAADHPLARKRSVSLKELAGAPMVLLDLPLTREYFMGLFRAARIEPNVVHRARSYEMVRAMVARGHGYSVLNAIPRNAVSYEGRRIAAVPIAESLPPTRVVMLRARRVTPRPSVESVARVTRGFFAAEWPALMATARRGTRAGRLEQA